MGTLTDRRMSLDPYDADDTASLLRTRSQELGVAESIAVQEAPPEVSIEESKVWPRSLRYLVLLCAFLTSLSFGVTQVPLLYVFRLMTCDAYYEDHGSQPIGTESMQPSETDRCSIHAIESSTALSISLLGASTTIFGLVNLFITGNLIKRIGVKPTLLIQVLFPALRLFVQNIGVEVWGSTGILIVQLSQIVSILGGPSGYLLALNTFITEVVEYEGRTAALGRLAGSMLFGTAWGFLLGGIVADSFGIKAPFRLTCILFLSACAFVAVFLPNIPPSKAKVTDPSKKASRFFGPLLVFAPRKFIHNSTIRKEYGAFLLAWGVFLGILATGYLATLLQLYATDVFGFATKQNGWLIFMYCLLRGLFLTFAFPKLIALGRSLTKRQINSGAEREPLLAHQNGAETTKDKAQDTFEFDLTYTKLSLFADGALTLLCLFVRKGWQMYLVAAILPFAGGTGSAAKGTVLQMVGSSAGSDERTDALAGVTLIENIARLSTNPNSYSHATLLLH
ncbi:MAG: hypothetical protein Q9160_002752 [Pyrenula sp. 1 TL-2023]